jgi:hypothetical protein
VTLAGTLGATSGGTGISTYTTGDILYSSATNVLSKLSAGTDGQVLKLVSGVPSWSAAGGSSTLTNTSFTATTGQTTFTVSYSPSLIQGVYRNGVKLDPSDYTATSGTSVVLNTGAVLGDSIQVQFFTALSLANVVTSISFGSTGLTPSTATTGDVTVAGTLISSNGGTGLSSYTSGDMLYYTSGTSLSKVGIGSSGQVLTVNGSGAPSWAGISGGTF